MLPQRPSQSRGSENVFDFEVGPDFLAAFGRQLRAREAQERSPRVPAFAPEPPRFAGAPEGGRRPEVPSPSTALLVGAGKAAPPKASKNPFENSDANEESAAPSLKGFLGEIDVSRISEGPPQRNYSAAPKSKVEAIRSMDFENISFEDRSQDFAGENPFFDLCSEACASPAPERAPPLREELRLLLNHRKSAFSQSFSQPPQAPLECPMSKSVMLGDLRRGSANPFQELSCASEQHSALAPPWAPLRAGAKQSPFADPFSPQKFPAKKNCFYESDDESEKDTHTLASKITFSPSKKNSRLKRTTSELLKKVAQIGAQARRLLPDMRSTLRLNESFLTQAPARRPASPLCGAFSLYRSDRAPARPPHFFRTQSQRSFFSQSRDKGAFSRGHKKSPGDWEPRARALPRRQECAALRRASPRRRGFEYRESAPSNLLRAPPLRAEQTEPASPGRPFSPSAHSHRAKAFWPAHLDDRFSAQEASFCSGLEPFLSVLSPHSQPGLLRESPPNLFKLGSRVLEANRRLSAGLLRRQGSFDAAGASELVALFLGFVNGLSGSPQRYEERPDLKKVKRA